MRLDCTKMAHMRKTAIFLSVCLLALNGPAYSAEAALTKNEVISAIDKARILGPGISVNAESVKEGVLVSTYRNLRATDDDCKIEAALIAKTVMELRKKGISRVTIYFFSTANPLEFREVAVTAGDIKAFAAGQTDEKQLIASLKLTEPQSTFLERQLMEQVTRVAQRRAPEIARSFHDGVLEVNTDLDGRKDDVEYQLAALDIGRRSLLENGPAGVGSVKLNLKSTAVKPPEITTFVFSPEAINKFDTDIRDIFGTVKLAVVKGSPEKSEAPMVQTFPSGILDIQKMDTRTGPLQDERAGLLERIRQLDDAGVGVKPYLEQYESIEEEVETASLDRLRNDIGHLKDLLDEQEWTFKISKEFRPIRGKDKTAPPVKAAPEITSDFVMPNLGGGPETKILEQRILADPNGLINYFQRRLSRIGRPGEDHPNFPRILDFFAATLNRANRPAEATNFEKRAIQLRKKRAAQAAQSKPAESTPSTPTTSTPSVPTSSTPATSTTKEAESKEQKPENSGGTEEKPQQ
jgi:hypothetical protein